MPQPINTQVCFFVEGAIQALDRALGSIEVVVVQLAFCSSRAKKHGVAGDANTRPLFRMQEM
jgi:hypothetical protein